MTFRQLGRRFWLCYFAGWIPYVGLFSSVFFLSGELPVFSALAAGLTNGINYTPKGGKVTVSAERVKNGIVVKVADTGIGIAKEDLPKIFLFV